MKSNSGDKQMEKIRIASILLILTLCVHASAVESHCYKTVDGISLKINARYPEGHQKTDSRPAILLFHGGGWVCGKPNQLNGQASAFAKLGYVTFTVSYRLINKNHTTVYECVKDAKSAVRWVRANAEKLGIDPNRIVASGGSAGGHIAACTAIIDGFEEEGEDLTVSSKANALLLLSAVLDTTKDGYGVDKMIKGEVTDLSPCHHVRKGLPPTIVFYGTGDTTVPPENPERFARLMKEAENICVLVPFEGRRHGFFNHPAFRKNNKIEDFDAVIEQSKKFLDSIGFKP